MSSEFFYLDENGRNSDAALHEDILAEGDHAAAFARSGSRPSSITWATTIRPASMPARRSRARCGDGPEEAKIHFQRLAVTPWQIENWNLPTSR